ncbi:MAG: ATP-binding cassette domain-containing protein [Bacteroidia bacterium]|nr:ATP-binding cassette domain-containing protein [Bacteroidia bacterium]
MSEKLLDGLMHLFAILAKEDTVTEEEQEVVRTFLQQQLTAEGAERYMKRFAQYTTRVGTETVASVAQQVNADLTLKQEVVVVVRLIELINADRKISAAEREAVKSAADVWGIQPQEYFDIFDFVTSADPHNLHHDSVLRVGPALNGGGPKHILRPQFPGFLSVLRIASVNTYIMRYQGSDTLYVNGLAIAPNRVYFLAPGSVIRARSQEGVYYSDIVSRFLQDTEAPKTVFEAREVEFRFPNGKVGLRSVNIREESGALIGLMGASGAGKSTLLNVLNGFYTPSSGQVVINGIDIYRDKKAIEGVIGYVSQDDLLIEELTVYQNLFYNAKLCFSDKTEAELDVMVTKLLADLGLSETRDLQVGNPLQKKISGGQRKRLNIGLELIREPAVMFVDEPTSGLSSRDSENIMDLLKELSLKGKLIFVVIHQPSSDIFKMFDKLYILDVGGYPIYYGNPVEAVTYFKRRAELINADYAECGECGNVNPEQIFNIIESKVLDDEGNFTTERRFTPQQWHELFNAHIQVPTVAPTDSPPVSNLHIPDRLRQLRVFAVRDVLTKLANTAYLAINFLEAPVLALILAVILRYYSLDESNTEGYTLLKNLNLPAYLFICILVALFMGLTVSAEEILRDRKILKREAFLNLSRRSYLVSKILILFAISAIQTLSFVLIGNLILGIDWSMWGAYWFVLFSVSCFANLLGLNISATFDNAVTIYILVPILLIPQIILSGVIVKFDKLNPAIAAHGTVPLVGDLMASRWAYEALAVYQYRNNPYERHFFAFDKAMSESQYRQLYWTRKLEGKLDFVKTYAGQPDRAAEVATSLALLQAELRTQAYRFNDADIAFLDALTPSAYSPDADAQARKMLSVLNARLFVPAFNENNTAKQAAIEALRAGKPEADDPVLVLKLAHHNESLQDLVTNRTDEIKVLEIGDQLIQNSDPIYQTPAREWRAPFFSSTKKFLGMQWDTLYFNMGVVWLMTALLYLTLYYESLRVGIARLQGLFTKRR